jgi:hypothetical protein
MAQKNFIKGTDGWLAVASATEARAAGCRHAVDTGDGRVFWFADPSAARRAAQSFWARKAHAEAAAEAVAAERRVAEAALGRHQAYNPLTGLYERFHDPAAAKAAVASWAAEKAAQEAAAAAAATAAKPRRKKKGGEN